MDEIGIVEVIGEVCGVTRSGGGVVLRFKNIRSLNRGR